MKAVILLKRLLCDRPIGLMGVADNGMLFTPSGKALFRVPMWAASLIQRAQHKISTWSREWAHPSPEGRARSMFPHGQPKSPDGTSISFNLQVEDIKPAKRVSRYELARRRWNWLRRMFRRS